MFQLLRCIEGNFFHQCSLASFRVITHNIHETVQTLPRDFANGNDGKKTFPLEQLRIILECNLSWDDIEYCKADRPEEIMENGNTTIYTIYRPKYKSRPTYYSGINQSAHDPY